MKTLHETEVLVIGAGIIGCSVAYHLARRGLDVTVVDSGAIGAGTSSANMALVWVQGKQPSNYMELNLLSSLLHAKLAEEFDEDVELRQPGGIIPCHDEETLQEKVAIMEKFNADCADYKARQLSTKEALELEPYLSPDIAGAIYGPYDGHINPFKFISSTVRLAKRHGTKFFLHTPILEILRNEHGIIGAETSEGTIRAKYVVVAAGTAAPDLVRPLGINILLERVRGQLLVTARTKPMFSHPLHGIRQTEAGNIMIGTTHESVGMDTSTTFDAARTMAREAIQIVPELKNISVIRQFSGIRPMPVDKWPYLGPVERVPGLYTAVSHSGVTLAPLHGKVISDLIVDGETTVPISNCQPERFSDSSI